MFGLLDTFFSLDKRWQIVFHGLICDPLTSRLRQASSQGAAHLRREPGEWLERHPKIYRDVFQINRNLSDLKNKSEKSDCDNCDYKFCNKCTMYSKANTNSSPKSSFYGWYKQIKKGRLTWWLSDMRPRLCRCAFDVRRLWPTSEPSVRLRRRWRRSRRS